MPTLADLAIFHRSYAVPTNKGNQEEQLLQYSDWSKARTECLVGQTVKMINWVAEERQRHNKN